jgi:hypothetical protein
MTSHYSGGKKYCSRCMRYFRTEGWRCPCCHSVMRDSPRQRRDKQKLVMPRIDPSKYMKRREAIEVPSS